MRENSLKIVVTLLIATLISIVILIAGNQSLLSLLSVYIAMILVSIFAYTTKDSLKSYLFGLPQKNLAKSILWGVGVGGLFYLVAKITGLSIGLPNLPQSIGDTVRNVIILGFAPIIESVFFQSVVYAFIYSRTKSEKTALFGQAGLFSVAHVSAYISGFYNYPSFTEGLSAFYMNIGAFVSAFLFAIIAMYILNKPKIRNLAFPIVFHFIMNLVLAFLLSVILI